MDFSVEFVGESNRVGAGHGFVEIVVAASFEISAVPLGSEISGTEVGEICDVFHVHHGVHFFHVETGRTNLIDEFHGFVEIGFVERNTFLHGFQAHGDFVVDNGFGEVEGGQAVKETAHVEQGSAGADSTGGVEGNFITVLSVVAVGVGKTNVTAGRNVVEFSHFSMSHSHDTGFDSAGGVSAGSEVSNGGKEGIDDGSAFFAHLIVYVDGQEFGITENEGAHSAHGSGHTGVGYGSGSVYGETFFSKVGYGFGGFDVHFEGVDHGAVMMVDERSFHVGFFAASDGVTEFENFLQFRESGSVGTNGFFAVFEGGIESVEGKVAVGSVIGQSGNGEYVEAGELVDQAGDVRDIIGSSASLFAGYGIDNERSRAGGYNAGALFGDGDIKLGILSSKGVAAGEHFDILFNDFMGNFYAAVILNGAAMFFEDFSGAFSFYQHTGVFENFHGSFMNHLSLFFCEKFRVLSKHLKYTPLHNV